MKKKIVFYMERKRMEILFEMKKKNDGIKNLQETFFQENLFSDAF